MAAEIEPDLPKNLTGLRLRNTFDPGSLICSGQLKPGLEVLRYGYSNLRSGILKARLLVRRRQIRTRPMRHLSYPARRGPCRLRLRTENVQAPRVGTPEQQREIFFQCTPNKLKYCNYISETFCRDLYRVQATSFSFRVFFLRRFRTDRANASPRANCGSGG